MLDKQLLQLGRVQFDEDSVGPDVVFGDLVAFLHNLENLYALVAADLALEVLRLQRFSAAAFEDVDLQRAASHREHRADVPALPAVPEAPRHGRGDNREQPELEPPGKFENPGEHVSYMGRRST